ncbi:MAG: putative urea ABC transporter substrate-binding protein [Parvibaculaceae bacterium]|nr:putative urea ABC transporter substrate-binding protein [Parvibaculaceae bacterium]
MKVFFRKILTAVALAVLVAGASVHSAEAAPKKEFKFAWSIYVGWMPWGWAADHGIIKKWADKYGIKIDVVQFNDYVESINQYTAGGFDGVTVTNMDALSIPAVGGVDTSAIIVGDYSNGNDAIILKDKKDLADIKGQKVNLVQYSVSHYLLARALQSKGMTEPDVNVVNTSDADMISAWKTPDVTAVVTWNPMVADILTGKEAHDVFDSSKIPGEIMDIAVVNTDVLKDNPDFAKALTGAWYETLGIMESKTAEGKEAREAMAKASGTDLAGFEGQLKTTKLFTTPKEGVTFTQGDLATIMNRVRDFLFAHSLLGNGAASADVVGIEFANGKILGDKGNVKFRFTDKYMKLAEQGKL